MAITIDWVNRIITVPKVDMVQIQAPPNEVRQFDLQAFRDSLKAIEATPTGMLNPLIHSYNLSITVGGATLAPVLNIINGFTITFENGQYRVNAVGANSNLGSVANVNSVSVSTSNSAGLQDLNSLQAASFGGTVAFNSSSQYSGVVFPVGTRGFPSNNLADATAIMNKHGIFTLHIMQDEIIGACQLSNMIVEADSSAVAIATILPAANVYKTVFRNLTMGGTLDGRNTFEDCEVLDVNYFSGEIKNCALKGTVTLGGNLSASISNCEQDDTPLIPVIDINGAGQDLILANWKGGQVKLINATGGTHMISGMGELIIDASCTGGTFEVYGDMRIINNSSATVLDETSSNLAANAVWGAASRTLTTNVGGATLAQIEASTVLAKEATVAVIPTNPVLANDTRLANLDAAVSTRATPSDGATVAAIEASPILAKEATGVAVRDMVYGGGKQVGTQLICYAPDNSTVIARFDLLDAAGNPTSNMANVVQQVRV